MLEGVVIVYTVLAVINLVSPMIKDSTVQSEIEKSYLCKEMYENNLILKVIL